MCNSLEFIRLCSVYCFRYSPIFLSKFDVEFISQVLCVDGLFLFFVNHQTNFFFTVTECYLSFVEFHLQTIMYFIRIFVTPFPNVCFPCFNQQFNMKLYFILYLALSKISEGSFISFYI